MTKILDWLSAKWIDARRWVAANPVACILIVTAIALCFIAAAR